MKRLPRDRLRSGSCETLAELMGKYGSAPSGILTPESLREACGHVWRDSNSVVMLGSDVLDSEPVSCDDDEALSALRRHIGAAGRRGFLEDVLPKLGFGPPQKT